MIKETIFITATDTDVGKTFIATQLLKNAVLEGLVAAALKPVSSGTMMTAWGQRNSDAILLRGASNADQSLDEINPIHFEDAVSPHIAAANSRRVLSVAVLAEACQPALSRPCDRLIIEGCGGWRAPLNDEESLADLVRYMKWPVILVVGIRLGCLNHAMLTAEDFVHDKVNCLGWIANCCDPNMKFIAENVNYLKKKLPFPFLEMIPYDNCTL